MRNSLTLFALAAAVAAIATIAACSDQQQPTSPATTNGAGRAAPASATSAASLTGSAGAQAKPTDQVGFTQLIDVEGPTTMLVQGFYPVTVTCPVGSQPISGGYTIPAFYAPSVTIYSSARVGNGWVFGAYIRDIGATAPFTPRVTCIK